jgi:hypothetical protein
VFPEELYDLAINSVQDTKAKDGTPDTDEPLPVVKGKRASVKRHTKERKGRERYKDDNFNPKTGVERKKKQLERNRRSAKESRRRKKIYIQQLEIQVINL